MKEEVKFNVENILVTLLIVCMLSLRNFVYFGYFVQFCFLIIMLKKAFFIKKKLLFSRGFFLLFALLSCLWCVSIKSYSAVLFSIIQIAIIVFLLSQYIDNFSKVFKLIDSLVISSFVLVINLLISTSILEWKKIINYSSNKYVNVSSSGGRLGSTVGFHPNAFGSLIVIFLLCCYYKYIETKQKRYLFLLGVLFILLLLSKSRSSLFAFLIGIFVLKVLKEKKRSKKNLTFVFTVVLLLIVMWSFINVPMLYKIVGYRLKGMFDIFNPYSTADASTTTRIDFIKIGFEIFLKNPLLGVGLNNYSFVAYNNYSIWGQVYAHNNYIELLADLGIIGFVFYYWIIIKCMRILYKTYKIVKFGNNEKIFKLASFLLTVSIVVLFIDFSQVTYYNECFQIIEIIIICSGFLCSNFIERNYINEVRNQEN